VNVWPGRTALTVHWVHRSGVDAAHDDLEALRLQLPDRGIEGRWAGRGGGSGSGQAKRGGRQTRPLLGRRRGSSSFRAHL